MKELTALQYVLNTLSAKGMDDRLGLSVQEKPFYAINFYADSVCLMGSYLPNVALTIVRIYQDATMEVDTNTGFIRLKFVHDGVKFNVCLT